MTEAIGRVTVLGAGTMGAAIAGHCANAGLAVYLLDLAPDHLTPEEEADGLTLESPAVRNRIVQAGYDRMIAARPASLFSPSVAERITLGNFTDNVAWIAEADWIVEAIVERLGPKQELMARIDHVRTRESIVSSNTSGIPLHRIVEGRSDEFKRHFLGAHFFNPPRYMKLLEIIPTRETDPRVIARLRACGERVLGKGVVICKDTPSFIANRIGAYGMQALGYALDHGYSIEETDALTGPLIGRPKTASFRLADLAGIDIMAGVADNLYAAIPHDESREEFKTIPQVARMVQEGKLGTKTNGGFYKRVDEAGGQRAFYVLDPTTMTYRPPREPEIPLVAEATRLRDLGERLRFLMERADAGDRHAMLVAAVILPAIAYAARRIPEISDDIHAVDDALRWGFAHQTGPFETWDLLGVAATVHRMERLNIIVAPWVTEMLAAGHVSFYRRESGEVEAYNPAARRYQRVRRDLEILDLVTIKAAGRELAGNKGASIVDLGEGVLLLEVHSKANTIGQDALTLLGRALDMLEEGDDWQALVIGNQGEYFSAGVDLAELAGIVQSGDPTQVESLVQRSQQLLRRVRFSSKPVVAAPFGQTLGLGVELSLACAGICAEGETYMGLVEAGVGIIPDLGGCKEVVRRVVSPPMRFPGVDPVPFLRHIAGLIGQARVSGSALEAREWGFLRENDRIILGRDRLIAEAKRMALAMTHAGYRPPVPGRHCYAAGRDALRILLAEVRQLEDAGRISAYDAVIGATLARVLCGGDLPAPRWVEEDDMLDREREGVMSLVHQEQTQQRIAHFLRTGKTLRN